MAAQRDSRYAFVGGLRVGDKIELDEPVPWAPDGIVDVMPVDITDGENANFIAYRLYKDLDVRFPAALYWVVLWFIRPTVIDPTLPLPVGTVFLPTPRFVQDVILSRPAPE